MSGYPFDSQRYPTLASSTSPNQIAYTLSACNPAPPPYSVEPLQGHISVPAGSRARQISLPESNYPHSSRPHSRASNILQSHPGAPGPVEEFVGSVSHDVQNQSVSLHQSDVFMSENSIPSLDEPLPELRPRLDHHLPRRHTSSSPGALVTDELLINDSQNGFDNDQVCNTEEESSQPCLPSRSHSATSQPHSPESMPIPSMPLIVQHSPSRPNSSTSQNSLHFLLTSTPSKFQSSSPRIPATPPRPPAAPGAVFLARPGAVEDEDERVIPLGPPPLLISISPKEPVEDSTSQPLQSATPACEHPTHLGPLRTISRSLTYPKISGPNRHTPHRLPPLTLAGSGRPDQPRDRTPSNPHCISQRDHSCPEQPPNDLNNVIDQPSASKTEQTINAHYTTLVAVS